MKMMPITRQLAKSIFTCGLKSFDSASAKRKTAACIEETYQYFTTARKKVRPAPSGAFISR